jgi:maltooligosyltrehalose trehalohydrolase
MHRFKVWAPHAHNLEVAVDGSKVPMAREEGGWWSTRLDSAGPGTSYAFSVDGCDPLPDPRSAWQPGGVHKPSCLVDQCTFSWTDQHYQARPLASAVIYELHVGTFTPEGTFDAAIQKLGYLSHLGVTHIELMPVNEFSGDRGWGYDGVYLYAPHAAYGGPEGLKRFVNAAHAYGLAVLLDVVYNHLGPAGNYLPRFGPYFTRRHATPWGDAVNLDGPFCHEVRRFLCDNALMWLRDYHFDGLRIDAVHSLIDNSATHLLEQLVIEVEKLSVALGRHLVLIAESDLNDPRLVWSRETGGYGLDAQWSDDFHHALHTVITGERPGYYSDFGTIDQLAKALKQVFVYDGCFSPFRNRPHGRRVERLAGYRFLGYIQNHDQVGNRATGDRISHLVNLRRAKLAAGLVLTSPFVPMLFQGEEWAASTPFQYFTSHEDPELGDAVSRGRRSEFVEFGWDPANVPDPQSEDTFLASKLRWDELEQEPHAEMLAWYRDLIHLRKLRPELSDGNLERVSVDFSEESRWLTVCRGPVIIACNFAEMHQRLPADPHARILAASEPASLGEGGLSLAGESLAVLAPAERT